MKTTFSRTCEHCGSMFIVVHNGRRQRFCSRLCFAEFLRGKPRSARSPLETRNQTCPQCSKVFQIKSKNREKIYCSVECYAEFRRGLTGEKSFNFGHRWPQHKRKELAETQKAKGLRGPSSFNWKGGKHIGKDGYVFVRIEWLSPADKALVADIKHAYVLEHRLVVARRIGRPLKAREVVHHINGIKDDNRDKT